MNLFEKYDRIAARNSISQFCPPLRMKRLVLFSMLAHSRLLQCQAALMCSVVVISALAQIKCLATTSRPSVATLITVRLTNLISQCAPLAKQAMRINMEKGSHVN